MLRSIAFLLAVAGASLAQDAREIVLHSLAVDNRNDKSIQNYTYKSRSETRALDKSGRVKEVTSELTESVYIGGKRYHRLLEKNGKTLPPKDAAAEQQKLDRAVIEANRLSVADRAKRRAEEEKNHQETRARMNAVPSGLIFELAGETLLNGRETYQILARPRHDYHGEYASLLRNMSGTLWIDKKDYQWVKAEAVTLGTVSFGFFLARVAAGTTLIFESAKINDEVWAPSSMWIKAAARLFLVKSINEELRYDFFDYRRFSTDAHMVTTE